jgi:hypothetical protein
MTPRPLLVASLVLLFSACAEKDPFELLVESRARTEVELKTWVEQAAPTDSRDAEPPAEPEPEEPKTAEPAETVEEQATAAERLRVAHLSLLVIDRGAPLELPCLTVDVVFETGEGTDSREIGRRVEELDISRLKETGGLDVVQRVPLPPESVSAIGVQVHEAPADELLSLCEARAIRPAGD